MNIMKMNKDEYKKFRLVINILVFLAFLMVFLFVEIKNIRQREVISSLIATVILSSLLMMLGILTIFPGFSKNLGKTLITFSILIFFGVIVQITYNSVTLFMLIELLLSIATFLYGRGLIGEKNKFIPVGVIAGHTKTKRR